MRAVIQRVRKSSVFIDEKCYEKIGEGMTILLGIEDSDTDADIEWLCKKIVNLRIFDDTDGVMNLSILDMGGEILIVSQFTLFASVKKGNRPSYIRAAKSEISKPIYDRFLNKLELYLGRDVKSAIFGADMEIEILNNGPVTIIIDTHNKE